MTAHSNHRVRRRAFGLGALAIPLLSLPALLPAPASAQRAVVQPLPDPSEDDLADALGRLSRNPESVPALVEAGRASLELQDLSAAEGFFARAASLAPGDGRVLAGQALVALKKSDPTLAIELFGKAETAGEAMLSYAAERGLAHDLVGDNTRAQAFYRQSLAQNESPEVVRRLALSQAIAGNREASEATLLPLLQRRDLAAYRTRAFALAIADRPDEAISIAETMLPKRISSRLAPYLRYMPRLTRAQQAAAANLGTFPRAADIGRDRPDIAAYDARPAQPRSQSSSDSRLIPGGEPLAPSPGPQNRRAGGELPAIAGAPGQGASRPQQGGASSARPAVFAPDRQSRPEEPRVAEAFAEYEERPAKAAGATPRGAVDITRIEVPREEVRPGESQNPSRHWVQVATGRDVSAFRWDWRRIRREADGLLDEYKAFHSPWGEANRLVVGPFDSTDAAQDMVTELRRQGLSTFRYTSQKGEEMKPVQG